MSEENKHNQDNLVGEETELHEPTYPDTGVGGCYGEGTAAVIASEMKEYEKKEAAKEHKDKEIDELGAFALHTAKKDPEEEIAAVAGVDAGGYAFHEHHENKDGSQGRGQRA